MTPDVKALAELRQLSEKAAEGPWFLEHAATKIGLSQIDDGRSHGMFPVRGEAHEIAFLHAAGEYVRSLLANTADRATRDAQAKAEGRREALEEAAKVAETWLINWSHDLGDTRNAYIEAQTTGRMGARRIAPETAKGFAREFGERSGAVYDCAEGVAAAIRALRTEEEA